MILRQRGLKLLSQSAMQLLAPLIATFPPRGISPGGNASLFLSSVSVWNRYWERDHLSKPLLAFNRSKCVFVNPSPFHSPINFFCSPPRRRPPPFIPSTSLLLSVYFISFSCRSRYQPQLPKQGSWCGSFRQPVRRAGGGSGGELGQPSTTRPDRGRGRGAPHRAHQGRAQMFHSHQVFTCNYRLP